ncbi:MAG: phosphate ABC transporter permease PstA [Anaerolineae bacterium]|jgi:phosphate transport system permease protein|nr:phosphate ABC transporter permease PstA [Anaerolineae bacterium]
MSNQIEVGIFRTNVQMRNTRGERFRIFYLSSLVIAFLVLIILIASVINQAFGLVAVNYAVDPDELVRPIELENRLETIPETTLRGYFGVDTTELDRATLQSQIYLYYTLLDQVVNKRDAEIPLEELAIQPLDEIMTRIDGIENVARTLRQADMSEDIIRNLAGNSDLWSLILEPNTRIIDDLSEAELGRLIETNASREILTLVYENLSPLSDVREMNGIPLSISIEGSIIPAGWEERPINDLTPAERVQLLIENLSQEQLLALVYDRVVREVILQSWNLNESVLNRGSLETRVEDSLPFGTELRWRSWLSADFITGGLTKTPATAGIYPALMGTLWLMFLTILIAFPLGVGAAIYLEEYASDNFINRIIEVNIRNLAGVPSIIYGMLGLALFVRALSPITSGAIFGTPSNVAGRTILSGALTLSLLILPVIISASQEAIRAVPSSLREGSFGLGATKWQTVSRTILPTAMPGILTGAIIGLARAIGETAPIVVIGTATFTTSVPSGPFSSIVAMPTQIFSWIRESEPQFRNLASGGIILFLAVLLTMNATAIILRQRASRRSVL